MERSTLPIGTDPEMTRVLNNIFDGAQGTMIDLSNVDTPTTANQVLKENEWGVKSGVVYFTRLGSTYSITPTLL